MATLNAKKVTAGAKKRSGRTANSSKKYYDWCRKGPDTIGLMDEKPTPGLLIGSEEIPPHFKINFEVGGNRKNSHLELVPELHFIVGDEDIVVDTIVETQAWMKNQRQPERDGEQLIFVDECDSYSLLFVPTVPMNDILQAVPDTVLPTVKDGKLIKSSSTPWIGTRFYPSTTKDGQSYSWNGKPLFGLEGVLPPLPDGVEGRGYERNGLPARVWAHRVYDGNEFRARLAVEGLELDPDTNDVHVRFAFTKHVKDLLEQYSNQLPEVTYETTSTVKEVSFIS
jgi:hypothetical protein